jgi:hypothetical protein
MAMKIKYWSLLALLVLAGCTTRSISDTGSDQSGLYHGELSEFDVVGVARDQTVSEAQIQAALAESQQRISLKAGSTLMLIQSGAMMPDQPMIDALGTNYTVIPFSGVPDLDPLRPYGRSNDDAAAAPKRSYSMALRLAAARTGAKAVITYWGVLESSRENTLTSTVSWVPVAGWVLPDESQNMRIRLKVIVMDVATGRWEMFQPDSFDESAYSSILSRSSSDQEQIARLKDLSYKKACEQIKQRFG